MWIITNERQNASPLLGFLPLFSSMVRDIGKYLATDLNLEFLVEFSNRHARMAGVISDWERLGTLTVQRLESPEFVDWIVNGLACETKHLNALGNKLLSTNFSHISTNALAIEISNAIDALNEFIIYNNFVNTSDFYHGIFTSRILGILRASMSQTSTISTDVAYSALTTPEKLVWIQEEEEDLLKILMLVQEDYSLASFLCSDHQWDSIQTLNDDLRIAINTHTQKYFWIRYEQEGEILDSEHFYNSLVQMLAEGIDAKSALSIVHKRRRRVLSQFEVANASLVLSTRDAHLLNVARQLVYWKLHLREVKIRFYCCADSIMDEAAQRLGLNRYQVRHLTVEELISALRGVIHINSASLDQRIKYCVFHFTADGTKVFEGQQAREAFGVVKDEAVPIDVVEVSGTCAYPGMARGLVKQVLCVEDADNFHRGNVLVAYMTDVGVVPAMRKASAIVTDVGGVTCHASIIAREFGIPCVIGTKTATKALLDGYEVDVNAGAGIVKILTRQGYSGQSVPPDLVDEKEEIRVKNLEIPTIRSKHGLSTHVRSLAQLGSGDVRIAGGKGSALGELSRLQLPVPPGFVVLTSAFEEFAFGSALGLQINNLLRGICDRQSLRNNCHAIHNLIVDAEVPSGIASEIGATVATLGSTFVAVRSSAPLEDSITASWAGQLESFLNTTSQDLLLNVRRCWASLFSERAVSYRMHLGLSGAFATAVVIQRMVESRISGTAFSVHPVSREDSCILVESCVGLGETLVLGRETPSTYMIDKNTLLLSYKDIGQQITGLRRAKYGGGNESFLLSRQDNSSNILSDEEVRELASLVIDIEKKFGFPVDVEWAYEGDSLYILQSRPITTLPN